MVGGIGWSLGLVIWIGFVFVFGFWNWGFVLLVLVFYRSCGVLGYFIGWWLWWGCCCWMGVGRYVSMV